MAEEIKEIKIELVKAPIIEIDPKKSYLIILPEDLFDNSAEELARSIRKTLGTARGLIVAAKNPEGIKVVEYDPRTNESSEGRISETISITDIETKDN